MSRFSIVVAGLIAASFSTLAAEHPTQLETHAGTLNGTLTTSTNSISNSKGPVALIIAGSGPIDQDGNAPTPTGTNNSLKLLAAALADAGFASVRYDKRGVAGSARAVRHESELRFEDYVQDAAAWVEALAKDSRFSGVIVVGHSEGSLIGMLAAQRTPALAFISIAGPAEGAAAVLRRQLLGRLPSDLAANSEAILSSLEAGKLSEQAPPALLTLYRPSVQPYLISWFRYTPTIELAKLRIPCLILQGDTDMQVSISDAEALHAAGSKCRFKLVPGMNHVMKLVPAGQAKQLASYGNPTLPVAEELVKTLMDFLTGIRPISMAR